MNSTCKSKTKFIIEKKTKLNFFHLANQSSYVTIIYGLKKIFGNCRSALHFTMLMLCCDGRMVMRKLFLLQISQKYYAYSSFTLN
ncbi:hypothetical protein T06_13964 [Trichinella sp. T6]|nr:hypothetical protein T06_13964 [Trichinella sp. T6]